MRSAFKRLAFAGVLVASFVNASTACLINHAAVISCESVFETVPFASSHASTLVETGRGVLAAWFGGTREGAKDVQIWSARLENGIWSTPTALADGALPDGGRFPTWNPVLFRTQGGLLMLFYKVGPNPRSWWGMVMTSNNEGASWSAPLRLPDGILGPTKNKPIELRDGTILAPSSTEDHGWHVDIESSSNEGATWRSSGPLNGDDLFVIQPTLLRYPDGRIQMLVRNGWRDSHQLHRIFQSWSLDRGQTWGPLRATPLPNPDSGIDAVVLHDGRAVLVFNDAGKGRSPLALAISADSGSNWARSLELENEPDAEFSYPAIIEDSNRKIQITYTWKRKTIRHVTIDPHGL